MYKATSLITVFGEKNKLLWLDVLAIGIKLSKPLAPSGDRYVRVSETRPAIKLSG